MTISELIEALQDVQDERGDLEVRIAYQPSWPLSASIENIRSLDEDGQGEWDEDGEQNEDYEPAFCWIATMNAPRHESGYAPKLAWEMEY